MATTATRAMYASSGGYLFACGGVLFMMTAQLRDMRTDAQTHFLSLKQMVGTMAAQTKNELCIVKRQLEEVQRELELARAPKYTYFRLGIGKGLWGDVVENGLYWTAYILLTVLASWSQLQLKRGRDARVC